jgi:hypothetical protein
VSMAPRDVSGVCPVRQPEPLLDCLRWLRRRDGDRAELGELLCACALSGRATEVDRQRARPLFAAIHQISGRHAQATLRNTEPTEYANRVTYFALSGQSGTTAMQLALDGMLTRTVRSNNLLSGSTMLRAAVLADGLRRPTVARTIALLRRCAAPDGGFGSRWHNPPPEENDPIRLPVTLDCAWALAEHRCPGLSVRLLGRDG